MTDKRLEQIKNNILAVCPPNNRPNIMICVNSDNVNEYIMEISQICERSYKCIKYLYIPSNKYQNSDKFIQIWYEDFINDVGYEPFINNTYEEKTENEIYKDTYSIFVIAN